MVGVQPAGELAEAGLVKGLHTVPAAIEIEGRGLVEDWCWISSTVDLGTPELKHRFVSGFDRGRWAGEHWCSSAFYDGAIFIVSQAVYRFLTALPQEETCELEFEPVELADL